MPSSHFNNDEKMKNMEAIIKQSKTVMDKAGIPIYAQNLQLDSFTKMLGQLNEINEYPTDSEQLVLTLHPKNLAPGEISVRALTLIMGGLQSLTDSIANTLYNQPSEKGKIPQEILDKNELIFKEARAGSFKALIEMKHDDQLAADDPDQKQVLDEVFTLLYSSRDEDTLSDAITFLGPRTLRTFNELTKRIHDLDIEMDLSWDSPLAGNQSFIMKPIDAGRINKILSDFSNVTEKDITVSGQLVGANTRTKTFELITSEKDKITGRIAIDALNNVASFTLGNNCNATLLKVTTRSSSVAREKISWTLKSLD